MVYRDEVKRTVLSVDVRDELRDLALEFGRIRERRRRDLDEHDIPDPLRVILQQLLEGTELDREVVNPIPVAQTDAPHLLHDTLYDIELIATNDDLLALVQSTEGLKLRLDSGAQPAVRT